MSLRCYTEIVTHGVLTLVPEKLIWEEHAYFSYLIELTENGISLQKSTACIPFTIEPYCLVRPSEDQWNRFHQSLLSLNLDPRPPEHPICDGFEVSCHIKFKGLKFNIVNPEFTGFDELSELVNQLTVCEDHPKGLLLDTEPE